jgi:hypothetical protein
VPPIFELTLTKAECLCATTAEIIQTLTDKINAHVMTVRPRSIGVTEFADKFVLAFLEPPMPVATEAMVTWVKSLQKSS